MTRALDIKQLIAEEASGTSERRALEEMTHRLDDALSADVPYRPEFKAQLRKRLMTQARQQLTPWYRRPAFLGSGVAVAAAAAVLFVGINMWQQGTGQETVPEVAQGPVEPPSPSYGFTSQVNEQLRDVPVPHLADERLTSASAGPQTGGAVDMAGLPLKTLTARPDQEQFRQLAAQLAFRGESRRVSAGWSVTDESRTLTLTDEGRVEFTDTAPQPQAGGQPVDADMARQVAHRFLDQAVLPIPALQPQTVPENGVFRVIYTDEVEGRPVANARTVVWVSREGAVVKAEAYVASGTRTQGTYKAVPQAQAIADANKRGGRFDRADLVWVRTPTEETVYLQPYWRVFGTDAEGVPVARYVPALMR